MSRSTWTLPPRKRESPPDKLVAALRSNAVLSRELGSLPQGQPVPRDTFLQVFGTVVKELKVGTFLAALSIRGNSGQVDSKQKTTPDDGKKAWKQIAGAYWTKDAERKPQGTLILDVGQGAIPVIYHPNEKGRGWKTKRWKQVGGTWMFDWGSIDLFAITPQPDGTVILTIYWADCKVAFDKGELPNRNPDRSSVYFRSDLQGNWTATKAEFGGSPVAANDAFWKEKKTLRISGEKFTLVLADGTLEGGFKVDDEADPKQITFMTTRKMDLLGIYSLDGDQLTVQWTISLEGKPMPERPKRFGTQKGEFKFVFRKDK